MLRYLGLAPPYRFERAFPAFAAVAIFLTTALTAATLAVADAQSIALADSLSLSTPRGLYLVYLAALCLLVLALLHWPKLAALVVLVALVEATIGIGSIPLQRIGLLNRTLLPPKIDRRFEWHSLLHVRPRPAYDYAVGIKVHHNAEGLRGPERNAADLANRRVIAIFGGSSTYDVAVPDGQSWPDLIEQLLGPDVAVLNYGVPGHATSELLIRTAFYWNSYGIKPRCAVYYVGWNDARNAHIAGLDPGYADFHVPAHADSFRIRRADSHPLQFSPAAVTLLRLAAMIVDTVPLVSLQPSPDRPSGASDPTLERYFANNVGAISAMNRQRGVRTIWIGQVLNRTMLTGDGYRAMFPYVRDRDVWPLQERVNEVLRLTAQELGDSHISLPIDQFGAADFVDEGHFTPAGSTRFARLVAPVLDRECR